MRLVPGFPTLYCSPAGDVRRDQATDFPLARGGLGVGGGITSGEHDGIGLVSALLLQGVPLGPWWA